MRTVRRHKMLNFKATSDEVERWKQLPGEFSRPWTWSHVIRRALEDAYMRAEKEGRLLPGRRTEETWPRASLFPPAPPPPPAVEVLAPPASVVQPADELVEVLARVHQGAEPKKPVKKPAKGKTAKPAPKRTSKTPSANGTAPKTSGKTKAPVKKVKGR